MKIKISTLVAVTLVSLALTTRAQEQVTLQKDNTENAEEAEYKNVNSFDPQSLQDFLKAFPSGKKTQDAKDALEVLDLIQKIKDGKITPDLAIPFENIGGADGWAGSGKMGFTGY